MESQKSEQGYLNPSSKVFSLKGYEKNQTFKKLRLEDPSSYKLLRERLESEL